VSTPTVHTIATARLRLRPARPDDAPALETTWRRPLVRRYLWDDREVGADEVHDVLATNARQFTTMGLGLWVVEEGSDATVIGTVGYWHFHEPPRLELLYAFDDRWWGRGLATEAAAALVRYGFEQRGLACVEASVDAPNLASVRVIDRLGFTFAERRVATGGRDTLFFRVSRAAFDPRRAPYVLTPA